MKKYIKKVLLLTIITFIVFICSIVIPIKLSIDEKKLFATKNKKQFIIIEHADVSSIDWMMCGDETGIKSKVEPVFLVGNVPTYKLNTGLTLATKNKFVLYGDFTGEIKLDAYKKSFKVFEVKDWEIIYPIEKYTYIGLISPKAYLNLYDFLYYDEYYLK